MSDSNKQKFRLDPPVQRRLWEYAKATGPEEGKPASQTRIVNQAVADFLDKANESNGTNENKLGTTGNNVAPSTSYRQASEESRDWAMLNAILSSGNTEAIEAVRGNLRVFYRFIGGNPDDPGLGTGPELPNKPEPGEPPVGPQGPEKPHREPSQDLREGAGKRQRATKRGAGQP